MFLMFPLQGLISLMSLLYLLCDCYIIVRNASNALSAAAAAAFNISILISNHQVSPMINDALTLG